MKEPLLLFDNNPKKKVLIVSWFLPFFCFFPVPLAVMMRRVGQSTSFSFNSSMGKSSNSYENYGPGYQPSPSSVDHIDQSAAETPVYSTMSADSLRYCRTSSGTSEFSEAIDDRSMSSEASPCRWPSIKSGRHNPIVLSRLGLKQLQHDHGEKLVSLGSVDSGGLRLYSLLSCLNALPSKTNICIVGFV